MLLIIAIDEEGALAVGAIWIIVFFLAPLNQTLIMEVVRACCLAHKRVCLIVLEADRTTCIAAFFLKVTTQFPLVLPDLKLFYLKLFGNFYYTLEPICGHNLT